MNELQQLAQLVKDLPDLAIFLIAAYLFYKLVIVGSIFGIVKLGIQRITNMVTDMVTAKHRVNLIDAETSRLTVENTAIAKQYEVIRGLVTIGEMPYLLKVLKKVAGRRINIETQYMHGASIDWLNDAIDEKIKRDEETDNG